MEYDFRDISPYTGDDAPEVIHNGIIFGDFDSRAEDLRLITRDAPTPDEKTVTEDVPFMQGEYDFSSLDGQRFFGNRELTYTFELFGREYSDRAWVENNFKRRLLPLPIQEIYDTHIPGIFHWRGKAKSVSADDGEEDHTLKLTLVFNVYPYAIANQPEGRVRWRDVHFPTTVFQQTKFNVSGTKTVMLRNGGNSTLSPTMIVNGTITITSAFGVIEATTGTYDDTELALPKDTTVVTLSGQGSVEFVFYREEMF